MSLLVGTIVDRKLLEGARLVAGKKGASNEVSWVNFMEILDALNSLQEGELLITTGFQLDHEELFHNFIANLKRRGVCGVAIQTGYYIHTIPKYILREADRLDFPVIELPAELTFSHIMHVLLDHISLKGPEKRDMNLLSLKRKIAGLSEPFYTNGETEHVTLLALARASVSSNSNEPGDLQRQWEKLRIYFSGRAFKIETAAAGSWSIYILSLRPFFRAGDIVIDLIQIITQISREDRVNLRIGISRLKQKKELDTDFDNSLEANRMLDKISAKKGVCYYPDVRFFQWFEYLQSDSTFLAFAYDTLKPLIAYDSFHHGDYLQTLRVFLANSCKISETAKKLFIHRHTLTSRMNRIAELCSIDFDDYFSRLHLNIALFFYDYFLS